VAHPRLTAAVAIAVAAVSLAGPTVLPAAAARARSVKAAVTANQDPISFLIGQVTSEVLFDISPQNIQAILADLPGL
jgi:hypothetical protein